MMNDMIGNMVWLLLHPGPFSQWQPLSLAPFRQEGRRTLVKRVGWVK